MVDNGWLTADALEFAPDIVRAQEAPPLRYRRYVLYALLALFAALLTWGVFGRLDIVAIAQGKLVPQTYLKVVQPADSGIVKEILVREGDVVTEGQTLMRMDTRLSDADRNATQNEVALRRLQLRRIDAELSNQPMARAAGKGRFDTTAPSTPLSPWRCGIRMEPSCCDARAPSANGLGTHLPPTSGRLSTAGRLQAPTSLRRAVHIGSHFPWSNPMPMPPSMRP